MERFAFVVLFVLASGACSAQEHQRVAATAPAVHRWEAGVDTNLSPYGDAYWEYSLAPRLGYEFTRTWSLSGALPVAWRSDPDRRKVLWALGPASLGLGWSSSGSDFRWRLDGGAELPWEPVPGTSTWVATLDTGAQWVRDPVILGFSVGLAWAERESLPGLHGSGFFQEVVNDNLTWSLVLAPRWTWYEGLAFWSVGVSWKIGWYEGPLSLASGISTGTGAPWSWSTSAGRSWDFP
jgi:hypothetical protein